MNVFLQNKEYTPPIKRNPYDLQRLNNGTWRSGIIYPIGWDEVGFGDSIRININAGIRSLPMPWPIQTPIIAKFYTFYLRYRTLQKNFMDFRFGNKSIVHPYIAYPASSDFWKTGGLGDYMGVPTTYGSDHVYGNMQLVYPDFPDHVTPKNVPIFYRSNIDIGDTFNVFSPVQTGEYRGFTRLLSPTINNKIANSRLLLHRNLFVDSPSSSSSFNLFVFVKVTLLGVTTLNCVAYTSFSPSTMLGDYYLFDTSIGTYRDKDGTHVGGIKSFFELLPVEEDVNHLEYTYFISNNPVSSSDAPLNGATLSHADASSFVRFDMGEGIVELSDVSNPFAGGAPEIPLSALPVRAYEAIYRSHFQDFINEPFIIDGEAQYNRYVSNLGDGADYTEVPLFHRNYEADRFTSCKPSPQQGLAPIVGVTSGGDIVLQRSDGEEISYSLTFDKDGVVDGWNERVPGQGNGDVSVKRRLLDLATTGFTINSLRDVNSYQRWKEATYRNSPKFKDQVRSVFGVNLEYKELDMPEFLGGFDMMLNVSEITQTSSSVDGSPLGDLAGRGSFVGRSKHQISHYCDEEGIVMTVMCITPIPVYSQMLDRKWLKSTPLDYYNPQFGKIGNQAVTYEEVCPVQAYNEGIDVHDVFGYQRPWYHFISSYDEVHGLFRNEMNGFVMQRIFGSTPELGKDFLHIDDSQLNEVFIAEQGQSDTFYGQINYDCKIKRSIPRHSVPSLD